MIDPQPIEQTATPQISPSEGVVDSPRVTTETPVNSEPVQQEIGGAVPQAQDLPTAFKQVFDEKDKETLQHEADFRAIMDNVPAVDSHEATRIAARTVDPVRAQQINEIAEKLDMDPKAAALLIRDTPLEELKTRKELENIEREFPGVSEWAQDPENYKILQQDPTWAKKTETFQTVLSKALHWAGDFSEDVGSVLQRNWYSAKIMETHLAMAYGIKTKEQGIQDLREAQEQLEAHPVLHYQKEMQKFQEESHALTKSYNEAYTAIRTGKHLAQDEKDNWITSWVARDPDLQALEKPAGAFIDYVWDRIKNPDAFFLQAAEGLSGMAPAVVGGFLGGLAGGAQGRGPVGKTIGAAAGGYTGGYIGFYGMRMMEAQEKYRDPKTGKIDFEKMYNDPKAIEEMRATANHYGLTHGIFGAISAMTAGKFISSAAGAAESKAAKLAIETAGQTVLSAGGETTARLVEGDSFPDAAAKGTEMAINALPIDVVKAPVSHMIDVYQKKQLILRAAKLHAEKTAVMEALKNSETDRATRQANGESSVPKDQPQKASDLMGNLGDPDPKTDEVPAEPVDTQGNPDVSPKEGDDIKVDPGPKRPNFKQFYIKDFDAKAAELGVTPIEVASRLGVKALDAYVTAKQGEHSFFQMDEADYHRFSVDLPELDDIAHTNGSEYNAFQAKEKLKEVLKGEVELYNDMVYHGTPHEFDQFDVNKVGTGEGAQAYGHGLYFTEEKRIADWYKKTLEKKHGKKGKVLGVEIPTKGAMLHWDEKFSKMEPYVQEKLKKMGIDPMKSTSKMDIKRAYESKELGKLLRDNDYFNLLDNVDTSSADPEQLQLMAVNAMIYELKDISKPSRYKAVDHLFGVLDIQDPKEQAIIKDALGEKEVKVEKTGKEIYNEIAKKYATKETDGWTTAVKDTDETPWSGHKGASKELNEAGIPGIRYFAEGQRGGNVKENFVVFDHENTKIVDKYDSKIKDPNATGESEGDFQFTDPDGEPTMGDPVLRPIQLLQKGRSPDDQFVFRTIRDQLVRALPNMHPEVADSMAEMQFQHTRFRADNLGRPIKEVAKELRVGYQARIKAEPGWVIQGQFQRGRTNQAGEPRNAVIFSRDSKVNTVIHEFGHAWLHHLATDYKFMSELGERNPRQQEYFEAMETAAKILEIENVGELYNRTRAEVTHLHEVWAKTAEKYFHEGDVPDNMVTKAFSLMKKWMASVAHMVASSYNGKDGSLLHQELEPTPEIARMFQTIVGGNNAVEEMMRMFPEPTFDPKIMGPNEAAYREAIANARSEAIAQMYAKFYNMSFREREALIAKAQNDLYIEAHNQIEQLPSIKLMRAIHDQGERAQLSHQSVLEVLAGGDEAIMKEIKDSTAKKIIAGQKKAGIDVRELMREMGVNDPKEMVKMLREMGDRDHMVEDLHNRLIDERFPILKTDEELHQSAVEAIQNEGRAKVIQMELAKLMELTPKLMQKMSGTVALPPGKMAMKAMEAIKIAGRSMVDNALYQRMNPKDFLKAANKSGKEAATFLAKGDYENAFHAKEDEAKNHQAFLGALAERRRLLKNQKLIERIANLRGKDIGYRYDADIFEHGQDIVRALETNTPIPEMDPTGFRNVNLMDPTRVGVINEMIKEVNASHGAKETAKMTVANFNKVGEVLTMITKAASEAKFVELLDQKIHIDDFVNSAARDIGERTIHDPTLNAGAIKKMRMNLITKALTPRDLFSAMMTEEGWARSTLAKITGAISLAEAKFAHERNADENTLHDAVKKIVQNSPDLQGIFASLRKVYTKYSGEEVGRPVFAPEIDHTFKNVGEVIQAFLYWGSESGREKLIMGGLMKDGAKSGPLGHFDMNTNTYESKALEAMFNRMMKDGTLTKQHIDFAKTVWDLYARHYEPSKEAIRQVYGYNIGEIKGRKLMTPWGEIQGGYVPLARDSAFQDLSSSPLAQFITDTPGTHVKDLFPSMNTNFTKQRTKAYYPLSLDLGQLKRQLSTVQKVAYMMPTMYQAGKIFDHPTFRQALETRRPGAMREVIVPWFKDVTGQTYTTDGTGLANKTFARTVDTLRKNARVVQLFWNTGTWAKHYAGLLTATLKVDTRHVLKAAIDVGIRPGEAKAEIASNDMRMRVRFEENVKSAIRSFDDFSMNFNAQNTMDQTVEKITYAPLQFAQSHVDAIVYKAAIEQGKRMGLSDADLKNYAANTVEQTQLTTNVSSRPSVMRGNALQRLITDYASIPLTFFNRALESRIRNADASKLQRLRAETYTMFVLAAVPMTVGAIFGHPGATYRAMTGQPYDDKEENYFQDRAIDIGADIFNINFPVVGHQVTSILQHGTLSAPSLTLGKQIGTAGAYFGKNIGATVLPDQFEGKELDAKDVSAMLDTISLVTGIPTTMLRKTFKTLVDFYPDAEQK